MKQVGDSDGYVQGIHPDGSETEKYPFSGGDATDANKKLAGELKKRNKKDVRKRYADLVEWTRRTKAS